MKKPFYILNEQTLKIQVVYAESRADIKGIPILGRVFTNYKEADKYRNYIDTGVKFN